MLRDIPDGSPSSRVSPRVYFPSLCITGGTARPSLGLLPSIAVSASSLSSPSLCWVFHVLTWFSLSGVGSQHPHCVPCVTVGVATSSWCSPSRRQPGLSSLGLPRQQWGCIVLAVFGHHCGVYTSLLGLLACGGPWGSPNAGDCHDNFIQPTGHKIVSE